MADIVRFTLSDGTSVLVAPPGRAGDQLVGMSDHVQDAARSLQQALAPIAATAQEVMSTIRAQARRPDEVQVKFGVQLDSKLGAVIASTKAGVHLEISLQWRGAGDGSVTGGDSAAGDDGSGGGSSGA
ncbi:CU044_2847 family protein [Streptomyces sp. V3I7]|uniref:CU044_2847 family protein n=1 Tax=Streptomyces sp. V3I7 TaxID=3042278 RepID=UPI00278045AC|nr:CU044_2847 family protein [Streptomyces sp. V3I7]MDQ0994701.1 hypothetical protein [Streptomyces sp. V3I7]